MFKMYIISINSKSYHFCDAVFVHPDLYYKSNFLICKKYLTDYMFTEADLLTNLSPSQRQKPKLRLRLSNVHISQCLAVLSHPHPCLTPPLEAMETCPGHGGLGTLMIIYTTPAESFSFWPWLWLRFAGISSQKSEGTD